MNKFTIIPTLACIWCASGLIALDFSILIPSGLSSYLNAIHDPVKLSTKASLLSIAPIVHILGALFVKDYKLWNPMKGGATFVRLQTAAWSIYAAALALSILELSQFCLTCKPGYLTAFALMLLISNSLIIYSVQKSGQLQANVHFTEVFTIVVGVAGVLYAVLNSHPLVKSESDTMFEGTELPFCEKPYQFSENIAQLPSAILHLPYVPFVLLLIYVHNPQWITTGPEQIQILVGMFLFQWWTALGHVVPNPRKLFVEEISIILSLVVLRAFINSMQMEDSKIGLPVFIKMLVLTLSSYSVFGLMPTIIGLTLTYTVCLSLMFNSRCNTEASSSFQNMVRSAMPKLAERAKVVIGSTLILNVIALVLEVNLCTLLLKYDASISWHAPFDLFFWQGFWPLIQFATISKPGSFWQKQFKIN
tara:strand:- start:1945 stop:3204 length:1260 start_codon:yes stop_codon:yes gene_type:complete